MSDYETTLQEKRLNLYEKLRDMWFGERKNVYFDGLTDMLNLVYYNESTFEELQRKPDMLDAVSALLSLKAKYEVRIKDLYDLLKNDQLYSALTLGNIDPGYFMCCVFLYIWGHAGFNLDDFFMKTCNWSMTANGSDSQNLFNALNKDIIHRLDVFYVV